MQEETSKLMKEEGINQTAGCLSSFIMMFLLIGVYRVVLQPLTYILRYTAADIENAVTLLTSWATENNIINDIQSAISGRPELTLMAYAKSNPEIFSSMSGFADGISKFHNTFLGFDLAGIPTFRPEAWTFTAVLTLLLPFLAAGAQLLMTIVSQSHMRKLNPAAPSMGAFNVMLYASPIISVWIGMSCPAGLSFYWFVNAVLQIAEYFILYKYLSGERLQKINEKEKQKVIAKGPTWMQRMMDQSMEQQNAMQGMMGGRNEGNRSRYADGDDGMSRKERAEYERKLIEARRRAMALKYGDELPDEDDSDND
jgi:YidC/Oxa1 family membrane protein insertase